MHFMSFPRDNDVKTDGPVLKPIAIVGISTEFPSGSTSSTNLDHEEFFKFLLDKSQAYEKIPSQRFNIDSWKGRGLGKVIMDTGTFLKDISLFDHLEFGITSKDAKSMAVSTRKLIELSFLALLDSGIDYRGQNVGCFMSGIPFDLLTVADADEFDARGSFAGGPCMIANRLSYHLDLLGPSIPTDTACSSSLSALHLAIQSLRGGECESAVVGGCQVNHRFVDFIQYSQGSVLAPDGKCKPFDSSADGFSRGEGAAVIVVKLLEDAIRDDDHIYATILGTGINNNGSAAPVSAPVAEGQADAMRRAYRGTGRTPTDIDYIELHATGTAAGDPTEANWVGEHFKRDSELLVGSVKGNIGHLEITAFLASLSKVCSMFKYGLIPPNVNLVSPNPSIKWDEHRLRVPTDPEKLRVPSSGKRRLVSICSSGIGGSNGHAVVEEPPPVLLLHDNRQVNEPILLMAGGLTPRSAAAVASILTELASDASSDVYALSTVYGRRSRQVTWRSFSVLLPDRSVTPFTQPCLAPRAKPPLVLVLSGQGPQHIQMGRQLFQLYPRFAESILAMDEIYGRVVGHSLVQTTGLFLGGTKSETLPEIWPIELVLPSLAMVQIALIDLLRSVGVKYDAVIGHSAGETAMLYACGAASQAMALELAIARGRAMSLAEKCGGTMAAFSCTPDEAKLIISDTAGPKSLGKLEIACFNTPEAITLAGKEEYITQALEHAQSKGFFARKIRTRVPVHSSLMEICRLEYEKLVGEVFDRYPGEHRPQISTFSALTGLPWEETFDADYFWKGTRLPVQFDRAMSVLLDKMPNATFLEISPHPALSSYIATMGVAPGSVICPMYRAKKPSPHHEGEVFLRSLGRLAVLGHNFLNFSALTGRSFAGIDIPLPSYPFQKKDLPYYSENSRMVARQMGTRNGPLNYADMRLGAQTHPELAQHVIRGEPIMPAAGYLEMALEFGARVLWNVEFRTMMSLPSDKVVSVDVERKECYWSVKSRPSRHHDSLPAQVAQNPQTTRLHADGYMSMDSPSPAANIDIDIIRARCQPFSTSRFYDTLGYFAHYGPVFRRIKTCFRGEDEALVELRGSDTDLDGHDAYVIHPAILDSCLHVMVHPSFTANADRNVYYLPSRVSRVTFYRSREDLVLPAVIYVHAIFREWRPDNLLLDFKIVDPHGSPICSLIGFEAAKHYINVPLGIREHRYDMNYQRISLPDKQFTKHASIENGSHASACELIILEFKLGDELTFQKKLSQIGQTIPTIWIHATSGLDGAAACGFSRSLRKELFMNVIRLVVFEQTWNHNDRMSFIHRLSQLDGLEDEIHVDSAGHVAVARLVSLPSPPDFQEFKPSEYWVSSPAGIGHPSTPQVPNEHSFVAVSLCSVVESGLWGFVGCIVEGSSISPGTTVVGVADGHLSSHVLVHEGRLWQAPEHYDTDGLAGIALGAAVVFLALGAGVIENPKRFSRRRILITNADTTIGQALIQIFIALELNYSTISGDASLDTLSLIGTSDVILSGSSADGDVQLLRSAMSPLARCFFWNDPLNLRQAVLGDHWLVGDALAKLLPKLSTLASFFSSLSVEPIKRLPRELQTIRSQLFDPHKTYLLVGGIGSFGVHCALWMYEKGARNLILTSRSGRASLIRTKNVIALRTLKYLSGLSDLTLRLENCDASSRLDMSSLMASISTPIGGCLLLSVALSDKTFSSHTQDTYDIPFTSKRGAFEALEAVYPISQLDFLVALSSATIFGNAGQTNYASANSLVDELTRPYSNAFSLVAPAIIDSSTIAQTEDLLTDNRLAHWASWAMSSRQICDCIEDGIRLLEIQDFWLYVPDYDWYHMQRDFGASPIYGHLVTAPEDVDSMTTDEPSMSLQGLVLQFLDVASEDFSPEVPFTSYGLDSLSAGRLAYALKPHVAITQLQLLADISLNDLMERTEKVQEETQGNTE
ncbi:polyketide synthase [Hygrophoropsis aurantiaca]|uniref:Polyketide synthase n=1 Tax=Hygrophoropsis aurantiaca TaxID=72124 RepID=A0ACB8A620_9AGAM|nr:polyketide synthase [Hygrophoropsis aurantiaca]